MSQVFDQLTGDQIITVMHDFTNYPSNPEDGGTRLYQVLRDPIVRELLRRYNNFPALDKFYAWWKTSESDTQRCIYCGSAVFPIDGSAWKCTKCNTKWTPARMEISA